MKISFYLTEHSSHFGPGNLVDGKETDRSEDDQNLGDAVFGELDDYRVGGRAEDGEDERDHVGG